FWAIQLWLIVLLFVYCALREFVRVVGRREVLRMFFISARYPPQERSVYMRPMTRRRLALLGALCLALAACAGGWRPRSLPPATRRARGARGIAPPRRPASRRAP